MPKLDETGIGIEKATGRRTVRICVDGKRYFETMPEGATLGQACARRDDMRKEAAGGGLKPGAPLTIEGLLRLVEVDHAAKHVSRATVKKFATASRRLVRSLRRGYPGGPRQVQPSSRVSSADAGGLFDCVD